MLGDDHFEFTRNPKNVNQVRIFPSDKFRESLRPDAFKLELTLVTDGVRRPLVYEATQKPPYTVSFELPKSLPSDAKIEIKAPRLNIPRGYVSTESPQQIEVVKIPRSSTQVGHSLH